MLRARPVRARAFALFSLQLSRHASQLVLVLYLAEHGQIRDAHRSPCRRETTHNGGRSRVHISLGSSTE